MIRDDDFQQIKKLFNLKLSDIELNIESQKIKIISEVIDDYFQETKIREDIKKQLKSYLMKCLINDLNTFKHELSDVLDKYRV